MAPTYRWIAVSKDGFVEQLVRYINGGHYFYVTGKIPEKKCPETVDSKMLEKFECCWPRWKRSRRKAAGVASVHYLRFGDFWILVATYGQGVFFDEHAAITSGSSHQFRDCRRAPIQCFGYSISHRYSEQTNKWHTLVRLDTETYKDLKAHLVGLATRRSVAGIEQEFERLSFQPFRPVREQLFAILRNVNRRRKQCGYESVDWSKCISSKRRITKPFGCRGLTSES